MEVFSSIQELCVQRSQQLLIHLAVLGKLKEGDKKYKGKFEIPNLSEENEPDEVDVSISVI